MHVKKNLMLWVAVLALALPLLLVGTASAKYQGDGAWQDGTNGIWKAPKDGICVLSVDASGNMVTDATVTTARDCQARLVSVTSNTVANAALASICTITSWNTDGVRYAAPGSNTCVTIDGSGYITGAISMTGVDRAAQMCQAKGGQLANATVSGLITVATKTTANGTAATCLAYGFQYRGQDATGTPLAFGAKGTAKAAGTGFCYATIRTGIAPASCPTVTASTQGTKSATATAAFGYAVTTGTTGTNCTYAYGVNGAIDSAMTAISGVITAKASVVDLSGITTMGECLAAGASWANWIPMGSLTTVGTGTFAITNGAVTFDLTRQAVNADEGCLHCHSTTAEVNGPAERFKDSYLLTGHKNMLRKVTAGKSWAGPDADGVISVYTSATTGTLNFTTAKATVSGTERDLLYLFGDWMAPAPGGLDVVVSVGGAAKYNGTSDYSCSACHTAGWSNTAATAGLCTLSNLTTNYTCTNGGGVWTPLTGVQAIGTPGYTAVGNTDAFPAIAFNTAGQWDLDGIQCGRCHNAAVPSVTAAMIQDSAFPSTAPLSGGMGALAAGVQRNNLCFGCHQSMAKTSNGTGLAADLAHAENLIVKNNGTAPAYIPGFSGHVLGNSFLNSPHARWSGSVVPNPLGKYDILNSTIATNSTYTSYNSKFRGYSCWQSPSSNSPAKTKANGTEITNKADCDALWACSKPGYATQSACVAVSGSTWTSTWRPDTGTANDLNSIQGTCATCHDVHQSLFVAGQEGLRKECVSCHSDTQYASDVAGTVQVTTINHPETTGTPVGIDPADPCVVCHMPKPTAADFPMHVWRINPDVNYSTFPTYTEFNGVCSLSTYTLSNTCADHSGTWTAATKKNANAAADGTYTNAVWVDIDLACGQCHGGSNGAGAVANGAPYRTKSELAGSAAAMHGLKPGASFTATPSTTTSYLVSFDASLSACPTGACSYAWDFGADSATGTGVTATYTYATTTTKPVAVKLTVSDAKLSSSVTHTVVPYMVNHAPVALGLVSAYPGATTLATKVSVTNAAMSVTFTDASTDADGNIKAVTVIWGDGSSDSKTAADLLSSKVFTHNYTKAGTFQVIHTVTDDKGAGNTERAFIAIVPPVVTVSGKITDANTGKNLSGVVVTMTKGTAVRTAKTAFTGSYKFTKTMPGTWTITATKTGYSFTGSPTTITAPTSTIVSAITGSKL